MIRDRYASAIKSSRLVHNADSVWADTDVLTAMGWAGKRFPLSAILARLYAGDSTVEHQLLEVLAEVAFRKGARRGLKRPQARLLASGVLAYHRNPRCGHCGGLGYKRMEGAPTLSTDRCKPCKGTGQVPLRKFTGATWEWLGSEVLSVIEAEAGRAFGEAAGRVRIPDLALASD